MASARPLNINGRENPPVGEFTIKMDFQIAGAFELLVNKIVHARLCADQSRANNGKTAAFFTVAGST